MMTLLTCLLKYFWSPILLLFFGKHHIQQLAIWVICKSLDRSINVWDVPMSRCLWRSHPKAANESQLELPGNFAVPYTGQCWVESHVGGPAVVTTLLWRHKAVAALIAVSGTWLEGVYWHWQALSTPATRGSRWSRGSQMTWGSKWSRLGVCTN